MLFPKIHSPPFLATTFGSSSHQKTQSLRNCDQVTEYAPYLSSLELTLTMVRAPHLQVGPTVGPAEADGHRRSPCSLAIAIIAPLPPPMSAWSLAAAAA